jgi:hypothetical protein
MDGRQLSTQLVLVTSMQLWWYDSAGTSNEVQSMVGSVCYLLCSEVQSLQS